MDTNPALAVPVDPDSVSQLATQGLELMRVDLDDTDIANRFAQAVSRGFVGRELTDTAIQEGRSLFESRRVVGVYDPSLADSVTPVATLDSWVTSLTVPGGEAAMWAISGVTVSATHRRRGIARALIEGELRAAISAGCAIAGLTVSEASLYGRYGFGSAIPVAALKIDSKAAGWSTSLEDTRLEYVERAAIPDLLGHLHDRVRRERAGQIEGWRRRWEQKAGLVDGDDKATRVRAVRAIGANNSTDGLVVYTISGAEEFTGQELAIRHIVGVTDAATRALWYFVTTHDLVSTVRAELQPVDTSVPWLVTDRRAVEIRVHDHGWLRILDVPRALVARSYAAPYSGTIEVTDPLGLAAGAFHVTMDSAGSASVTPTTNEPELRLSVATLSSLYLGATSALTLRSAGLIDGEAGAVAALDRALHAAPAPYLSIWY